MLTRCMIDLMSAEYGKDAPSTVSRDKAHEYLGMTFGFADMPEEMIGKAPTPAAHHLFKIRKGSVPIEKETRSIKSASMKMAIKS